MKKKLFNMTQDSELYSQRLNKVVQEITFLSPHSFSERIQSKNLLF